MVERLFGSPKMQSERRFRRMQTMLSHLIHSPTTSPTRNSGAPRCGIVATMPTTSTADPTSMPPARWQSRLAALKSRSVGDTDHRVVACLQALSYWRVRRAVEAELGSGSLTGSAAAELASLLSDGAPAPVER